VFLPPSPPDLDFSRSRVLNDVDLLWLEAVSRGVAEPEEESKDAALRRVEREEQERLRLFNRGLKVRKKERIIENL
jgi:hypothetical protein